MSKEQPLKDVLQRFVKAMKIEGKLNEVRLKEKWIAMVGEHVAKHTTEIKLYGKKLFVTLDSAPLRQELNYSKGIILKNINEEFKDRVIEEVVIR
jgi:predicted nucleic acid-binding Zn ribbon protein